MHSNLIRIDEVMRRVGISRGTVYRWIKDGRLPPPLKLLDGQHRAIAFDGDRLHGAIRHRAPKVSRKVDP